MFCCCLVPLFQLWFVTVELWWCHCSFAFVFPKLFLGYEECRGEFKQTPSKQQQQQSLTINNPGEMCATHCIVVYIVVVFCVVLVLVALVVASIQSSLLSCCIVVLLVFVLLFLFLLLLLLSVVCCHRLLSLSSSVVHRLTSSACPHPPILVAITVHCCFVLFRVVLRCFALFRCPCPCGCCVRIFLFFVPSVFFFPDVLTVRFLTLVQLHEHSEATCRLTW